MSEPAYSMDEPMGRLPIESLVKKDDVLVDQALAGDREAFDALVLKYQDQAVSIANIVLKNFDLARDAAQNGFAKAYFNLKSFRKDASFKTWLVRIVMNEAKSIRRKERLRRYVPMWSSSTSEEGSEFSVLEIIPATGELPSQAAETHELKERMKEVVMKLPERERQVFMLHYFEELTLAEVAQVMEIAVGTAKAHLSHATEKFKTYFGKEGIQNG